MNQFYGAINKTLSRLLLLFLLMPSMTNGQVLDTFPKDSARYIESLAEYMEDRISDAHQGELENFIQDWQSGAFKKSKRDSIVKISNALLDLRANREPHFLNMLSVIEEMQQVGFEPHRFDIWMKGFNHLLREKKSRLNKVDRYFQFTRGFLRSGGLHLSAARNWYALSQDYRLVYDTTLKVVYQDTDLKCRHREDSIQIYGTQGTYYPFQKSWKGAGGRVNWQRAGYSKNQINARLTGYRIDMTKAEYRADSVYFTNNLYFDNTIRGKLHDKLQHIIKPGDAQFPVFNSYKQIFEIGNIYENMDFTGGFKMKGGQFIGSGGNGGDARLEVHRNGKVFMTVRSEVFILRKDKAVSRKAETTIHLKNDSIYHTGLGFHYNVKTQEIELIPNENILSKSVYYNTYHQVSMKFDRLLWNTNKDKIYFTHSRNSSMGQATFTSMNYFTLEKWLQIEMRDRVHPLIAIRNYHNKIDGRRFGVKNFSNYMRLPAFQVRQRLMRLAQDGFVFYDLDSDTATINDKLFDYIQARIGKIDYDVIQIESSTSTASQHNAILNLDNMNMQINGVGRTFVSDSQNVVLYPDANGVVLKKNRNFDFGGAVIGGLFTFYGDSLSFNYEDFTITMDRIDSLHMQYKTDQKNQYGQKVLANVQNTVNDLTGVLHIDHPNNKSGKKKYPKYPVFEGKKKSYVYYDHLFNGPYKRENFYFELYPFTMDSLDNFNPENMKFKGMFHSALIFPPFEETLELQPDNSLGFEKTTGEGGLPLYEGKGTYYRKIHMSNQGLQGKGKMEYLTADLQTDDILFFPDSTSIHASRFNIEERTTGIPFPDVDAREVDIKWYPHKNDMNIWQTNQPFAMYQDKSSMEGYMNLKPTGLTGKGKMDMNKATLESQHFEWEDHSFDADTSNFRLKTINREGLAFASDTLNAHVNYNRQQARFRTIEDYTIGRFPQNLYQGYLDEFVWEIDSNKVEIASTPTAAIEDSLHNLKDSDRRGAVYMSTHKGQDSLRFISPLATLRLADTTLVARKVESLHVADAKIFPNDKTLRIRSRADMDTLRKSRLVADHTAEQPHEIFDASLKVKGRNNYTGYGDYEYASQVKRNQIIHFSQINVDDSLHTRALGTLAMKDSFKLSPWFRYAGDVHLKARRKLLRFDGSARMMHSCSRVKPHYVQFASVIDPMDVRIPIGEKITNRKGRKIFAGSFVTIDSTHIYSTFLTPRKDPSDNQIISTNGWLNYNKEKDAYEIASRSRLEGQDSLSPYLALDRQTCRYRAEGKMDLGVDFGKLQINPVGELTHNMKTNKVSMNLSMPVEFHFSQAALDSMARDLRTRPQLTTYDPNSERYRENLFRVAGHSNTNRYFKAIEAPDSVAREKKKLPKAMDHSILFSNLDFEWNTSSNSYIARENIRVAAVNGKPVNKKMNGYVEIVRQKFGDKFYIYLTPDNNTYYFFYYFRGMMRTNSSNRKFVRAIKDVPKRKRNITEGFANTVYRYILATSRNFSRFKKHMDKVLEDITSGTQAQDPQKDKKSSEGEASGL